MSECHVLSEDGNTMLCGREMKRDSEYSCIYIGGKHIGAYAEGKYAPERQCKKCTELLKQTTEYKGLKGK